jgi:uncharacterized protein YndB with AHSA1/START domain
MVKVLKVLGLLIVVAVLAVLGLAATKPDQFAVERSTTISAPPEKLVAALSDFHAWAAWSPYEKLDPSMKKTFSGPPSGVGSVYEWSGNTKAGTGRMEITDVSPGKVTLKLDFQKPFEAHNFVDFILVPEGTGTKVTWSMHGPAPFMTKVASVFVNMDKMIGKDFEAGLASLKSMAEKS